MFGDETIEVSTFRSNRGGEVESDATGRITSDNVYGTQAEDAARRDFTINALYYDPTKDVVVDFMGGLKDVEKRTLRLIGNCRNPLSRRPGAHAACGTPRRKTQLQHRQSHRDTDSRAFELIKNVPPARLFDEIQKLLLSGYANATSPSCANTVSPGVLPCLDLIYQQPGGQKFIELALDNTDRRVREDKPVSPAFLFASLLWHQVVKRRSEIRDPRRAPCTGIDAGNGAGDRRNSARRSHQWAQRFAGITREIWLMQPRFEQRTSKAALRMVEQPRFRAAYDFLLLRAAAGEIGRNWRTGGPTSSSPTRTSARADQPAATRATQARRRRHQRRRRAPATLTWRWTQAAR